jgi:hypothetical protein
MSLLITCTCLSFGISSHKLFVVSVNLDYASFLDGWERTIYNLRYNESPDMILSLKTPFIRLSQFMVPSNDRAMVILLLSGHLQRLTRQSTLRLLKQLYRLRTATGKLGSKIHRYK